ncbi:MAG: phytoene desaturase family protein, partial [Candidatus Nanoarchaeia archaeon]
MKKHSTGALTKEQHDAQNKLYSKHNEYDYLIIGTGNAALTVGALLANNGKKVCMLEAHDTPGGYAHSFKQGDYHFCAQIHYIWGCYQGGKIIEFLKKIGLEKKIKFNLYDPEGYDHVRLPNGKTVKIPMGYDKLAENIDEVSPGQKKNVQKFCRILTKIREEMGRFPLRELRLWEYPLKFRKFITLIRYRNKTLQDVFDECRLSKEAQAVLSGNAGDFMSPPEELSILFYVGLFGGYNVGAYYPKKHYKYYVESVAKFIKNKGGHIYYETLVTKINTKGDKVTSVETKDGKTFTAKKIICNGDPQATAKHLIGWNKFPDDYKKLLSYEYSPAGMVVYLGLKKGFDLKKYGFGKHNVWHLNQWDMNTTWKEQLKGNFSRPWFFISTPTLHSNEPGIAPRGCQIMEIATLTDYTCFKKAQDRSYREYNQMKQDLVNKMIDWVQDNYVPDLRDNIVVKTAGGRTTNLDFVLAPEGNAYGSKLTSTNLGSKRLKAGTPWKNFFWCNASSG